MVRKYTLLGTIVGVMGLTQLSSWSELLVQDFQDIGGVRSSISQATNIYCFPGASASAANSQSLYLDFIGDGSVSVGFSEEGREETSSTSGIAVTMHLRVMEIDNDPYEYRAVIFGDDGISLTPLSEGDVVGADLDYDQSATSANRAGAADCFLYYKDNGSFYSDPTPPDYESFGPSYYGLRLDDGSDVRYGWISMEGSIGNFNASLTVHQIVTESTPDTPVVAGQTSVESTPEPGGFALMILGGGIGLVSRRRRIRR